MDSINILVAEDEPIIASKIKSLIEELGWSCTVVHTIPRVLEVLDDKLITFNAIVLDRILGNVDSADFLTSIKNYNSELKIFIVSAIDSSIEKANLIDSGADDYLAKPFESAEFKARLKALMRNARDPQKNNLNFKLGNTSFDLIQRIVSVDTLTLNLTVKEYLVLNLLSTNIGKIYSKNQLIEVVWGFSLENETNVVESTVNSLRRKLESAGSSLKIKNTRYVGYWIEN